MKTNKQEILQETFAIINKRQINGSRRETERTFCSFIDHGLLTENGTNRIIYRHYATLYFVFAVDKSESELGILDLIQVLVEVLDNVFENVCELDLIFHMEKVQCILSEMVQGGMVLETNLNVIVKRINEQEELERVEIASSSNLPPVRDVISSIKGSRDNAYISFWNTRNTEHKEHGKQGIRNTRNTEHGTQGHGTQRMEHNTPERRTIPE